MALEGSIRDFGLPDIIQFLRQQNKTGVLTIRAETFWAKVLFEEGRIAFAVTQDSQGAEGLARQLLEAERVSENQMEGILKAKMSPAELEKTIVGSAAMTMDEMQAFVALSTREILFRLFRLEEGRYSFETDGSLDKPSAAQATEADFILLEGMRQFDEWPQLRRKVPENNLIFDKVPEVRDKITVTQPAGGDETESAAPATGGIGVSPDQMTVYRFVDGLRDVDKIVALSGLGEFECVKALTDLLGKGAIVQKGVHQADQAVTAEAPVEEAQPQEAGGRRLTFILGAKFWINAALVILLLAFAGGLGNRIQRGFKGAEAFRAIISGELYMATKNGIRQADEVYYLRNLRMPETAADLLQANPRVKGLLLDVRRRGARYPLGP